MSRNSPEGKLLTLFEAELDRHHTTFRFRAYPPDQAWFLTLATFDPLFLPMTESSLAAATHLSTALKVKELHDCVIYALRFLWRRSRPVTIVPTNDPSAFEDAATFLTYCRTHSNLTDAHVAYGRGVFGVEADEAHRRVRFVPTAADGSTPEPAGMIDDFADGANTVTGAAATPRAAARAKGVFDRVPHHTESGRIVIDTFGSLNSADAREFAGSVVPREALPLQDADDLGGFTAGEFRAFWLGLLRWSMAALGLYMRAWGSGRRQYDHLPTQFLRRDEFVSHMVELSGLPPETVEACTNRLTYGRECRDKPDPYLQPLVCTASHVLWSPHLVVLSKSERNVLKLTARIPLLKSIADDLIGGREASLLNEFGRLLGKHGYQYKTRIPLPDGVGEVDLLAYHDKHPETLLVVEGKAFLGVDEVAEVAQATKEMVKGQGQLARAVGVLEGLPAEARRALWSKPLWQHVRSFAGVVLTPNVQPDATYSHSLYPAVALETVRRHFQRSDYKTPGAFWEAAVAKRWLGKYRGRRTGFHPVTVGSVTYELPVAFE